MKRISVVWLLSSLCAVQALATTYVRVEKDGSKTYSDRPLPGGKEVELQPAQTYSAPPPSADPGVPREQQLLKEMSNFSYTTCTLTPKNDETFTNPPAVNISVSLNPVLRPSDIVDLKVDGNALGGANTTSVAMTQPDRGTHSVALVIKDRYGKTLCGASTTFHVLRPSLNSPVRH